MTFLFSSLPERIINPARLPRKNWAMRSSPPSKNQGGNTFTCFDSFCLFFCVTTSMPADSHSIIHMQVSFHPFWVLTLWLWSGIKKELNSSPCTWPSDSCSHPELTNHDKHFKRSPIQRGGAQKSNTERTGWTMNLPAEVTSAQDTARRPCSCEDLPLNSTTGSPYTPRVERNSVKSFSSFWERCPRVTCPL